MSDDLLDKARQMKPAVVPHMPEIHAEPGSAVEVLEKLAWGEVWARPGLSMRDKRLITIAVLGINGTDRTLGIHIRGALDSGDLTEQELDAFIVQFAAYAGFPRGSAFGQTLSRVIAERAAEAGGQV